MLRRLFASCLLAGFAAVASGQGVSACPVGGPCKVPASIAGGSTPNAGLLDPVFGSPLVNTVAPSDLNEAVLAAFLAGSVSGRRPVAYVLGLSAAGELVRSSDEPPMGWPGFIAAVAGALCVAGCVLLFAFWDLPPPAPPVDAVPIPAPDNPPRTDAAAVALAQSDALGEAPVPDRATHHWTDLVRAAGGDPVRAARIIDGEVAVDPSLDPGSSAAISRAMRRLVVA